MNEAIASGPRARPNSGYGSGARGSVLNRARATDEMAVPLESARCMRVLAECTGRSVH